MKTQRIEPGNLKMQNTVEKYNLAHLAHCFNLSPCFAVEIEAVLISKRMITLYTCHKPLNPVTCTWCASPCSCQGRPPPSLPIPGQIHILYIMEGYHRRSPKITKNRVSFKDTCIHVFCVVCTPGTYLDCSGQRGQNARGSSTGGWVQVRWCFTLLLNFTHFCLKIHT